MPIYRARAELRRSHPEGQWLLAGVFLNGRWHPVARGIGRRPSAAGRLTEVDLPAVIASSEHEALRRALFLGRQLAPDPATAAREQERRTRRGG